MRAAGVIRFHPKTRCEVDASSSISADCLLRQLAAKPFRFGLSNRSPMISGLQIDALQTAAVSQSIELAGVLAAGWLAGRTSQSAAAAQQCRPLLGHSLLTRREILKRGGGPLTCRVCVGFCRVCLFGLRREPIDAFWRSTLVESIESIDQLADASVVWLFQSAPGLAEATNRISTWNT